MTTSSADIQQKLIYGDPVAIQDGLHNLIQTPAFQSVMSQAIASYFGPIFEPALIESLRRFLAKSDRADSRSYAVGVAPATRVAEREIARVELWIYNNDPTNSIYVGGRQVSIGGANDANGGIPIPPKSGLFFGAHVGEFFAVAPAAGLDVRVLDFIGGILSGSPF